MISSCCPSLRDTLLWVSMHLRVLPCSPSLFVPNCVTLREVMLDSTLLTWGTEGFPLGSSSSKGDESLWWELNIVGAPKTEGLTKTGCYFEEWSQLVSQVSWSVSVIMTLLCGLRLLVWVLSDAVWTSTSAVSTRLCVHTVTAASLYAEFAFDNDQELWLTWFSFTLINKWGGEHTIQHTALYLLFFLHVWLYLDLETAVSAAVMLISLSTDLFQVYFCTPQRKALQWVC